MCAVREATVAACPFTCRRVVRECRCSARHARTAPPLAADNHLNPGVRFCRARKRACPTHPAQPLAGTEQHQDEDHQGQDPHASEPRGAHCARRHHPALEARCERPEPALRADRNREDVFAVGASRPWLPTSGQGRTEDPAPPVPWIFGCCACPEERLARLVGPGRNGGNFVRAVLILGSA